MHESAQFQSNLIIVLHAMSLFCNFISTTAYLWPETSLQLPLAVVIFDVERIDFGSHESLNCLLETFLTPFFFFIAPIFCSVRSPFQQKKKHFAVAGIECGVDSMISHFNHLAIKLPLLSFLVS